MEAAQKRRRLGGAQLRPDHAAAAREMLRDHDRSRSNASASSSSSSSDGGSASDSSDSSDGGATKNELSASDDEPAEFRVSSRSLHELLPGEYVHPSVRCTAVEGKALGLVLQHPVPGGTLLLRSVGLRVVPEADGASVCLAALLDSLAALAKARPHTHERLLHRFATMAPRPITRPHRDAYVANQSVVGVGPPGATAEQRRTAYEQWLGTLVDNAPGCGLASGADALDLLVRLSRNIYDQGASAGAALLNHSCAPNVALSCTVGELQPGSDDGQDDAQLNEILCSFDVWSVDAIDAGAELSASYLSFEEQLLPTVARRAKLQEWGFHCNCTRCSNDASDSSEALLTAVRCLECETGYCSSIGASQDRFAACIVCGRPAPADAGVSDLLSNTERALEVAATYEGDPETQWSELSALYAQLTQPAASDSDALANRSASRVVQLHPRHWLMTRLHLRAAAAARELLPALRPALESEDSSLVDHATQVFRHALLGVVVHLRTALCAASQICSPHDRLVGSLRSRLAAALQNAANEPAVALHAYTVLPDSPEEEPEEGSAEETALAVRRCREEAVAHERAAIAIEKLNPAARGAGAAQDLAGMLYHREAKQPL